MALFGKGAKGKGTSAQSASAEPTEEQTNALSADENLASDDFEKGVLACAKFLQTDICKGKEVAASNLLAEGMSTEQATIALKHIPEEKGGSQALAEPENNNIGQQFSDELGQTNTNVGGNEQEANNGDGEEGSDVLAESMQEILKG